MSDWHHRVALVEARRSCVYGEARLWPDAVGIVGIVRDWQGYPQADVKAATVEQAQALADTELDKLRDAWQAWRSHAPQPPSIAALIRPEHCCLCHFEGWNDQGSPHAFCQHPHGPKEAWELNRSGRPEGCPLPARYAIVEVP